MPLNWPLSRDSQQIIASVIGRMAPPQLTAGLSLQMPLKHVRSPVLPAHAEPSASGAPLGQSAAVLHWPARRHMFAVRVVPDLHSVPGQETSLQAKSSAGARQVPVTAWHCVQTPLQRLPQQTPSVQKPLRHCVSCVHAAPLFRSGTAQEPLRHSPAPPPASVHAPPIGVGAEH